MKAIKIIIYSLLFVAIGELLIRIDKRFDLLNSAPAKINIAIEESNLLKSLEQKLFIKDSSQFRILVIGDSFIHGGGIDSADKFSKKLSSLLNNDNVLKSDFFVLDVSRPNNNTLDNFNSFAHYYETFSPHVVFWAYNFNDVLEKTDINKNSSDQINDTKAPFKQFSNERVGLKKITKQVYSYSELLRYLSTNIQKELKTHGIVLPFGDFNYLTKKAYLETSKNWQETQRIISKTAQTCQSNNSEFILYKMPEFNLLHLPELFSLIDSSLFNYCNSFASIKYINGNNDFKNVEGDLFKLSKYDGHPNAQAHLVIANGIYEQIKNKWFTNN